MLRITSHVNEDRRQNDPISCIKHYFKEAFIYLWDELGMELSVEEYNELLQQAIDDFDISKEVDFGNQIRKN